MGNMALTGGAATQEARGTRDEAQATGGAQLASSEAGPSRTSRCGESAGRARELGLSACSCEELVGPARLGCQPAAGAELELLVCVLFCLFYFYFESAGARAHRREQGGGGAGGGENPKQTGR